MRGHAWCQLTDFCERCGLSATAVEDGKLTCQGDETILPATPRIARRRMLEYVEKTFGKNVLLLDTYIAVFRAKLRALHPRRPRHGGIEVRLLLEAVDTVLRDGVFRTKRLIETAERRLSAELVAGTTTGAPATYGTVYDDSFTLPARDAVTLDESTVHYRSILDAIPPLYSGPGTSYPPAPGKIESPEPEPA